MKELYRFRQFLTEGVIKENISLHKEEAKRFLEKFVDDNEDKFEFIPDLETGYIDANDNSYNVDELASIFLDIGQDIPRGTHNQKYKGEGGTYVVVSEGVIKENMSLEIEDDIAYLSGDSGEYEGEIEDGKVDFSVVGYEEEREDGQIDFEDYNWKDILGPKHIFVQISDQIPTKVEAAGDYVMITVDLEDLKKLLN